MRTSTITTRLGAFSVVAGIAVLLSGCTASANLTVAAEDVATVGAKALSTQWDTVATMDCGDGSVDSVEGTEVECTAFNPKSGLDYPATVTLKTIDGGKYTVSVVTGSPLTPDTDADEPVTGADAPTVTGAALAGIAAPALGEKLGYEPAIDCGTEPIPIYLDARITCVATTDDGVRHAANVVVTSLTATDYSIDVAIMEAPLQ
ncbi:hypothetical protein [Cryobacterium cryoconiti]|uniref:DUF4333 domain-containing protein n=1 Tax=Cryobacterium cryoconiti TaxID=1259239 RepID=A0A4Y8JZR0_9MICO|nr:hypothetical protein [Cryobacterium cryoconiti]TFD33160.1 hypothetical protein E3T49_02395 [Cryobacterium cryoconiti]